MIKRCPLCRTIGDEIARIPEYKLSHVTTYKNIIVRLCRKKHVYAQADLYIVGQCVKTLAMVGYKIPVRVKFRIDDFKYTVRLKKPVFEKMIKKLSAMENFFNNHLLDLMLLRVKQDYYFFTIGKIHPIMRIEKTKECPRLLSAIHVKIGLLLLYSLRFGLDTERTICLSSLRK